MDDLEKISKKHPDYTGVGGDKCIRHNYCKKYDFHFKEFRKKRINLLEIGVAGGSSLNSWKEYFPFANIIGIDIKKECKQHEQENIKIEIGDQKDHVFLKKIEKKHGPFDIIIDDGSHKWKDVIFSFIFLFPKLKQGGIYVIEDLHTSYFEKKDYKISPIEYLKKSIDKINMYGRYTNENSGFAARASDKQKSVIELGLSKIDCDFDIYSLTFYPSICFIQKEKYENKRKIY